jgi:hypothetical protein
MSLLYSTCENTGTKPCIREGTFDKIILAISVSDSSGKLFRNMFPDSEIAKIIWVWEDKNNGNNS